MSLSMVFHTGVWTRLQTAMEKDARDLKSWLGLVGYLYTNSKPLLVVAVVGVWPSPMWKA